MKLAIILIALLCPFLSMCQPIIINGKVIDEQGIPVSGATVILQGSKGSAITDEKGQFTLNNSISTDTIIVTASGYQTAKESNNQRGLITIVLKRKITALQEIILHSGYQDIPKERATGSFTKIDNDLINRSVTTNILERLKNLSPGLLFDKNAGNGDGLNVRGIGSIFASTRPLIVVDNFPYDGDIQNINSNDVESITLLKDAAAASIWGAAAGNGIIVIATRSGRFAQPLKITVNSILTNTEKPDFFYYPSMSSSDFIDLEKYLFSQGFYNSTISNTTSRPVLSPVVEILVKQRNGLITQAQADALIDPLRSLDLRLDIDKYFYRAAVQTQHSLSFEGGSAVNNYFLGIGADRDLSTLVGNEFNRYTVTAKNTFRPFRKFQLQTSIAFVQSTNRNANNGGNALSPGGGKGSLYPYAQLADAYSNPLVVIKDYRSAFTDTAGHGLLLDWKYRPLEELNLADKKIKLLNITMNLGLRYDILKFLSIEARYQFTKQTTENRQYYDPASYFVRNLVNRFTQINGTTVKNIIPKGGILDLGDASTTSHSGRLQLNFNHNWSPVHQLTALAGAEIRQVEIASHSNRSYGYNDEFLTAYNIDYADTYPVYASLTSASRIPNLLGFSGFLDRYVSVFANAAYTLHSKYILSASVRKDASNLFGVKTNQKAVPLWSSGIAWNINKESFYKSGILPVCRLRITYGYSGNIDNTRSAFPTIEYASAPDPLNNLPYANIVNPANPSLRWEKIGMLNIGIDFGFKNDRITGSVEYYRKNAQDLFSSVSADFTTGFSSLIINSANIKGRGVDVQLNTINTKGGWEWSTFLLFSYSKNTMAQYFRNATSASLYVGSGNILNPVVGKDAYALFSYRWGGLDASGDPQGYFAGQLSKNYTAIRNDSFGSLRYHGSAAPLCYGAVRNIITWRRFSASVNISFKTNYYFRHSTINYSALVNSWTTHSDYALRWQKPGDEAATTVPSFIYPVVSARDDFYTNSEATVERADHIRLQDIRLAYKWTAKQKRQTLLKTLEAFIYINTQTILWRANNHNLDPDYFKNDLPAPLSCSFGLRLDL
jgi:TonB-linked SusC/RagA family outer membrane protein